MKKVVLKILGILMVVIMVLQTMSIAATQSELKNQKNENEKKMNEAQSQLDDVKEEKAGVQEEINDLDSQIDLEKIESLAQDKKVVAIGEIGLDYYWNKENKDLQKDIFVKQIEIANKMDLPISIHTREAVYDTLEVLKNRIKVKNSGIFHCCPLNIELIKEAVKLGFYISFSGNVTFKNSKNANKCIEAVPIDKLLIETDSPYMTPEPYRGKRNNSIYVKLVAQKIAEVRNMELEDIAKITLENAKRVYKIVD